MTIGVAHINVKWDTLIWLCCLHKVWHKTVTPQLSFWFLVQAHCSPAVLRLFVDTCGLCSLCTCSYLKFISIWCNYCPRTLCLSRRKFLNFDPAIRVTCIHFMPIYEMWSDHSRSFLFALFILELAESWAFISMKRQIYIYWICYNKKRLSRKYLFSFKWYQVVMLKMELRFNEICQFV